jgi:hypothetical protein
MKKERVRKKTGEMEEKKYRKMKVRPICEHQDVG